MLIPWLAIFDIGTIRANFKKPIDVAKLTTKSENFALLVPIFNDIKFLHNVEFLKDYAEHVVLCTTTQETPEFLSKLTNLANEHKFRISYSTIAPGKKNPWAIYNKTLLAHETVLKESVAGMREKFVIFIDADTVVDGDLRLLAGAMEDHNFDLASVKVLPMHRTRIIQKLQGVEYDIAMQARLIYPWLTSGAGMIAKREMMEKIMKNHSLFFNGGDIEIGKLADLLGYHVGHIPMKFYTEIPATTMAWIRQRFSWMSGCFRHAIINFHHNLRHPFHFIYFSFMIYFLFPLKVYQMAQHWMILPYILALYTLLTIVANWKVRSRWMLVFPIYALFQVLVLIWFGVFRYVVTVYKTGNFGRIKIHHAHHAKAPKRFASFKAVLNHSTIFAVIALIIFSTSFSLQKRVFGRTFETELIIISAKNATYNAVAQLFPIRVAKN
ncbi:MAG: glycosyltransferase family 2 protein [Patescibacteria group bacterium]